MTTKADETTGRIEEAARQLSFEVIASSEGWPSPRDVRRPRKPRPRWVTPQLLEFERRARLAGWSASAAAVQMRSVRSILKVAARQRGRVVDLRELFLDADLLAAAACDAERLDGRGDDPLTDDTLASRRIAARLLMRLMEDYLGVEADVQIEKFHAALLRRCELVGQTYCLKSGKPTGRKPDPPTERDIDAQLREVNACRSAYYAERNVAFICLLAATGLRLGSAIEIDGRDFYRLGSSLCLAVPREKCKRESVQVYIPPEVEAVLVRYVIAFNRYMVERGSTQKVGLGVAAPFWRSPPDRAWTGSAAAKMIRFHSVRTALRPYGPHAIRRFVAQSLVKTMPRRAVAEALRWEGVATLDKHYGPAPGRCLEANARPSTVAGKRGSERVRNGT